MNSFLELRNSPEFKRLSDISARLGQNPLQVQGPGGNTSIKKDGAMWIKASGTWLGEALNRDIFVPVHSRDFADAVRRGDSKAENTINFSADIEGAPNLHASIETCVHAVLNWPVVLHTHCVETIAVAVRANCETLVNEALAGLHAVVIPYVKPGLDLAKSILDRTTPETRILVLGNHGLVATGKTVDEAHDLLVDVSTRLSKLNARLPTSFECRIPKERLGNDWMAAPTALTQAVAFTDHLIAKVDGPTLYPDHLIFLGPGCVIAKAEETIEEAAARASCGRAQKKLVIVPGEGVAIPKDASPALLALAEGFGNIISRLPEQADLLRLTEAQEDELINWDAEKIRQALNQQTGAGK